MKSASVATLFQGLAYRVVLTSLGMPPLSPVPNPGATAIKRNIAVDAYRGLVMLLMMGEVLSFAQVQRFYSHSLFWRLLAYHQTHVEWSGMSLHDMIQPSFTFLVGVALPYSIASRMEKGQSASPAVRAHFVAIAGAGRPGYIFALDRQHAAPTSRLKTL